MPALERALGSLGGGCARPTPLPSVQAPAMYLRVSYAMAAMRAELCPGPSAARLGEPLLSPALCWPESVL